jgi:hypothetical protein
MSKITKQEDDEMQMCDIISALVEKLADETESYISDMVCMASDYVDFLISSEIISPEQKEKYIRTSIHVAIDHAIDDEMRIMDNKKSIDEENFCSCGAE